MQTSRDDTGTPAGKGVEILQLDEIESLEQVSQSTATITVAVGTEAARRIADLGLKTPVLYTLIPESAYLSLAQTPADCATHAAIYIDQPLERQARLAGMVFPDADSYGVLLGPVSRRHLPLLEAIAADMGRELIAGEVQQDMEPEQVTRRLVETTDLMLALSDPKALNRNNAKWLLYTAYQQQNPVIGFSSAYVRAGAAAAVYSTPGQLGRQTAEFIQHWQQNGADCLPPAEHPAYFSVATNPPIIHSLGGITDDAGEFEQRLSAEEEAAR